MTWRIENANGFIASIEYRTRALAQRAADYCNTSSAAGWRPVSMAAYAERQPPVVDLPFVLDEGGGP